MANLRRATIYCFKTFSCACKTVSIVCVFVAIAFIIAGVVMVVKNKKDHVDRDDDYDDDYMIGPEWQERLWNSLDFFGSLSSNLLFVYKFLCISNQNLQALSSGKIGTRRRDYHRSVRRKQHSFNLFVSIVLPLYKCTFKAPQPQPGVRLPPTYPTYAADYQPQPQGPYPYYEPYPGKVPPQRQAPPIPNLPPTMPPAYEDVVSGAPTAPPAEAITPAKL
ncbi:unnamed protein product [Rodentolepis nana]|uniref:Uncharacterized protein n=1 Tax=Rodentolepis nana TaxID=102285 RepID=A0A0R3TX09_RODNA|nr:unnamed protein product [Rodentolepis nana]